MSLMLAVEPSYWQRTLFGLVGVLVLCPALAIGVLYLRRVVTDPRAAGRRWPEGAGPAGSARVPVELFVDLQRAEASTSPADVADALTAIRVGLLFLALATVPLSTGLVVTQPGLGLFVLPVVLLLISVIDAAQSGLNDAGTIRMATRIGAACMIGLSGGAVAAQWGSSALPRVIAAQAHGAVFGVAGWGLPTAMVQLPAFVLAILAIHATLARVDVESDRAVRADARGAMTRVGDGLLTVACAAWIAVAFLGGGAVPWEISNDGVRHVVSATLTVSKVAVVAAVLTWGLSRRPVIAVPHVRRMLLVGVPTLVVSIGATMAARAVL